MENSKSFRIFRTLSRLEYSQFGEFVRSPYIIKSGKLRKLYEFIYRYYPDFKSEEINKTNLFKAMYPGEDFNDKKLRDYLSLMLKLAQNYLSHLRFRKSYFDKKINLLKELSKRNAGMFEKEMDGLTAYLEKSEQRDEEYYFRKYTAENIKRKYYESKTQAGKMKPVYDELVIEDDNFLIYTIITYLMNYFKLKNAETIINFPHKLRFYKGIISYIENDYDYFKDIPAVQILFKFHRLYKSGPDGSVVYTEVKLLLDNNPHVFSEEDRKLLYTELYNYCKEKQSKGSEEFRKESFEVMKEMAAKNWHLENDGFLHPHNFINCTATALRANELEWAEDFINESIDKVRAEFRHNAFNYCLADLNYNKGRRDRAGKEIYFKSALGNLTKVKKEDFYCYVRIKNMKIKIYYELGEMNQCLDQISSYKKSFDRNDLIPEDVRERCRDFIRLTQKVICLKDRLINLNLGETIEEKENLCREISESSAEFKKWLTGKVEEIK